MNCAYPNMLWLLAVIPPALVLFFWWSWRKREWLLTQFIQARLLPGLTLGISHTRDKIRLGCIVLSVVCLITALARPQWGFDWEDVKLRGLDIVVAIDTSKSMLAGDIPPNRLERAKLAALDLMHTAKSDRLGLVAFAGTAFLECPLTIDDAAFRQSVETLDVNTIPQGGTALAEAIDTSMTAFKEGDNYKVLVLITDGEDHDSGAVKAAENAAKNGLHIFTIGIGTKEGEILQIRDAQGKVDYIRDEQGNVVKSRLDEGLLQEIAQAAQGFYLPLRGAKTIETLYQQGLAPLPKSQHQEKLIKQYHERYHWPLALAIIFLLIEMLLPESKRDTKSKAASATNSKAAVPAVTAMLTFFLLWPAKAPASPSAALKDYQSGNYPGALEEYERLLQKHEDDPRLHFNAGAAAYRNKQFDEATRQFDKAIATPDLNLQQRAYFNRGNALFRLGDSLADSKKKSEQWEQSLKDFEVATKLNQKDPDAKFNYDFVKRKLEELKQQQQQQQQQKNNKDDQQKQDQQNQQNQNGDQSKKDQQQNKQDQKQQQSDQNNSSQNQQGQGQNQDQQKKDDRGKKNDQKQDQQNQQPDKPDQQQAGQQPDQSKDNPDDQQQQEAVAAAAGQMTQQQAKQLLDAQKGEEQLLPTKHNKQPIDPNRPVKDW